MIFKRYKPKHLRPGLRREMPVNVLLAWVLVGVILTTGSSLARYSTTASGSDGARVAKFEVEMAGVEDMSMDGTGTLNATLTDQYTLTVTNNSEVAVEYKIELRTAEPLPAGLQLSVGDSMQVTGGSLVAFEFPGGTLAPGAGAKHVVKIDAVLQTLNVDVNENITVNVIATQVD